MEDEDELDQELLDIMGASQTAPARAVTGGKRPPKQSYKRRRKASSEEEESDDYQSSLSSDSDDLSDYAAASGSEDEDSENEMGDLPSEISESELVGLNELEREARISEYAEKRQQYMERLVVKRRLQAGKKDQAKQRARASNRDAATKRTRKRSNKKLEELRARRSAGKKANLSDAVQDDILESKYEFSADEDDEAYTERIRSTYTSEKRSAKDSDLPSLDDINGARVTRDQLEKWMFASFFKDVVEGAYVRLGIGMGKDQQQAYRVTQIKEVVKYHRIYKVNNAPTNKALLLKHGKAEKVFLMDVLSNSKFTQGEYDRWIITMKSEKQRIPPKHLLVEKKKEITEASTRVFTDAEISTMLKEKQEVLNLPKSWAREKAALLHKQEELTRDGVDAADVQYEIQRIDEVVKESVASTKLDVWSKLNERNRKMNLTEGSQAEVIARESRIKTAGKANMDPFARIKVVPTHVFTTPGPANYTVAESPLDKSGETTPFAKETGGADVTLLSPAYERQDLTKAANTNADGVFDDLFAEVDIDLD